MRSTSYQPCRSIFTYLYLDNFSSQILHNIQPSVLIDIFLFSQHIPDFHRWFLPSNHSWISIGSGMLWKGLDEKLCEQSYAECPIDENSAALYIYIIQCKSLLLVSHLQIIGNSFAIVTMNDSYLKSTACLYTIIP